MWLSYSSTNTNDLLISSASINPPLNSNSNSGTNNTCLEMFQDWGTKLFLSTQDSRKNREQSRKH